MLVVERERERHTTSRKILFALRSWSFNVIKASECFAAVVIAEGENDIGGQENRAESNHACMAM